MKHEIFVSTYSICEVKQMVNTQKYQIKSNNVIIFFLHIYNLIYNILIIYIYSNN